MINKLAILGGTPIRTTEFPQQQNIGDEEKKAVMEVLESGILSKFLGSYDPDFYGGLKVKQIEHDFKEYFGVKHAISTNSATTSLQVAVAAAGIGPGDEVIVSPYTMTASASCILMQNAIPVFADIQDDIFCLDPESIRKNITPQTKAILVVNIFGHPADMKPIMEIAKEFNLKVIEDSAQSIGAKYEGKYSGTIGDLGVYSLNYHKIIHSGEGGMIVTDDDDLARRCQLIRNHGEVVVEEMGYKNIHNILGSNYRMTEIESAIGVEQLKKLDFLLNWRRRLADYLAKGLSNLNGITPPVVYENATHSYYVYPIKYDEEKVGVPRNIFVEALESEGIPIIQGYTKPLYLSPLYQQKTVFGKKGCPFTCSQYKGKVSYDKGICPVTERLYEKELMYLSLCHYPITERDLDDVINAFKKVIKNGGDLKNV